MNQAQTISWVFGQIDQLPWNHCVYLEPGVPALMTRCIVWDPDDVEADQDLPERALQLGFVEGLGIDDIRSIKENARLQGKLPTDEELIQAFAYYLENDAFIDFGQLPAGRKSASLDPLSSPR